LPSKDEFMVNVYKEFEKSKVKRFYFSDLLKVSDCKK